jgi:SAM-dependent methyltransferase
MVRIPRARPDEGAGGIGGRRPDSRDVPSGRPAPAGASLTGLFDREAARYDAWFDGRRGRTLFASELLCLQHVADGLPRPWLEIGVGSGRFARALGMDLGVDPARGALAYATRRGVRVLAAAGQALPFAAGQFGAAFVIVTLCFAADPAGLLREAARVTRADGGVVLGVVPAGSPWGKFYASRGEAGHTFYSEARFFTLFELKGLARAAGLIPGRSASTLFQEPGRDAYEPEDPRDGETEAAGFAAMLCHRR